MATFVSRIGRAILLVLPRRIVSGAGIAVLGTAVALAGVAPVEANGAPAVGAVPSGFKADSITWTSFKQGWVLGTAPCGARTCSDVIGTTDAGHRWKLIGRIGSPIAQIGDSSKPGTTEIRFANKNVGWAFAPRLLRTVDGGKTWTSMPIPGGGKQVLALASNATWTYAVVSSCRWMTGLCSSRPLTFWRTRLTGSSWTSIPLDLPINVTADVAVFGGTAYVVDAQFGTPDRFYASTDGRHFSARPVPCVKDADVHLVQVVPTSKTDVALLCVGNPGFSKADKFVFRSSDTGMTTSFAGRLNPYGYQSELAVSPSGKLAVASSSDGSFIYTNDNHKTNWVTRVAYSDGGRGWNDIVYVSARVAWVVYSPVDYFSGIGKLFVTHDSGRTWYLVTP